VEVESLVHPTIYAAQVLRGDHVVNDRVRLACERHMHDLERDDIYFDQAEFVRLGKFISGLEVADGHELTGQQMVMLPWQSFLISSVLCWKFKETKGIRYKIAFLEVARGAGKSTMMGVLMLYVSRYWEGSDNLCLANKTDQARQAYDAATKIAIRAFGDWRSEDKEEADNAKYECTMRETRCRESGGRFRPMASKTGTLDGTKAILYVCDEGAESREDYFQKVISALPKLRDSMMVSVTTPGSPELGLDSHYYTRRRLAEEAIQPENWDKLDVFGLFYGIDDDDDPEDEAVWQKAQPSLGHVIPVSQYRRLLNEYKAQDALHNWERYQCCAYSLSGLPWLQLGEWRHVSRPLDPAVPEGTPIYCATDFSKSFDLTSMAWGYWKEGKFHVHWHHWAIRDPHVTSAKRHYQKFVDNWARHDYLEICEHKVNYELVKEKIQSLGPNLARCGYDALGGMKTEVQGWGDIEENYSPLRGDLPMWSLPQTIVSLGPATYLIESMIRNEEIVFNEDAVVEYALPNVQLQENANGDRRPCKMQSMGVIDPIVAVIMLAAVLIKEGAERPGAYANKEDIVV
tara:strand:- start:14323 stop:16041 length:1719 start_codon:yes stop_codon:yes gene_type:complete